MQPHHPLWAFIIVEVRSAEWKLEASSCGMVKKYPPRHGWLLPWIATNIIMLFILWCALQYKYTFVDFFFVVVPMFFPFWYDSDIEHKRKIYAIEISSRWCCKALRWGVGEEPFSPDLLWCLLWNILLFGWQWECCSTAIFSLWKSCRQTTGNIASSVCLSVGLDSFSCDAVSCVMQLSETKDSPLSQLATK